MNIAHVTDIHLDHLKPGGKRQLEFEEELNDSCDAVVITGDIATHPEAYLLGAFAKRVHKPIYFVLGNHDYWGGNFNAVPRKIREICARNENLHYLTESEPIDLGSAQLIGVDGWYDARIGIIGMGNFWMADWSSIKEFQAKNLGEIIEEARDWSDKFAAMAAYKLVKTTANRVFFATHVPPYPEASLYDRGDGFGLMHNPPNLPFYTSKAMGDILTVWAMENPEKQLHTLCGHSHAPAFYIEQNNHWVHCGGAEYGHPRIARIYEL